MKPVVTGYAKLTPCNWACQNCGAVVYDKRLHDEWHQALFDAILETLQ